MTTNCNFSEPKTSSPVKKGNLLELSYKNMCYELLHLSDISEMNVSHEKIIYNVFLLVVGIDNFSQDSHCNLGINLD